MAIEKVGAKEPEHLQEPKKEDKEAQKYLDEE